MARSTVSQVVQIGVEATSGTAVPANKRLGSLSIALSPEVESRPFRPRGVKYPTVVAANKEWASGDLEGTPTYDEIVYPLAGVLTTPVVSQVMNGGTPTGAYLWEFDPSSTEADVPRTFTVEQGDATHAERAAHVLFSDFGMAFSRDEVTLSGTAVARALERGITLTAAASAVAEDLVPILPGQVCVYVSDTVAGLGDEASHLETGLSVEPSLGGRFSPVWYLNCREDSWSTYVEGSEPDASVDFVAEANADGIAWADRFRTGETVFIRVEATGPEVAPGVAASAYRLTMDYAVKVLEPGAQSDEDGVYAVHPSLQIVHDAAWGRAMRVQVVNTVAAL